MRKLLIDGRIGQDAKISEKDGRKFVTFSVANTEYVNQEEQTTWYDIISSSPFVINTRAKNLKKGARVLVQGDFTVTKETANDGRVFVHNRISAEMVEILLYAKSDAQGGSTAAAAKEAEAPAAPAASQAAKAPINLPFGGDADNNGDLPF